MTAEDARKRMKEFDEMEKNAEAEHEHNLAEIEKAREAFQERYQSDCPHEDVKPHRVGFKHRWYDECVVCGAELETANEEVDRG